MNLRLFTPEDGVNLISRWILDPEYEEYFRCNTTFPSIQECASYPAWANNLVMIVEHDGVPVGMVSAFQSNWRHRTTHIGILIDKRVQNKNLGYNAVILWLRELFNRFGFRKVLVDVVNEDLLLPLMNLGFKKSGRRSGHCFIRGQWVDEIELECFAEDFNDQLRETERINWAEEKAATSHRLSTNQDIPVP